MFPFGDQCLTPPSVHHTPTSWLSTRTSSQDSRGTSHLTWYPVQVPACACLWTPPSLSRQGCSFRKQVANYSLLVGSLRSDEHSLGPSTINQIPCGRSESATGTGTRIESKGGFQRDSEVPSLNATFLLQDRSSQPLLLFLLYHNALGLAFTLTRVFSTRHIVAFLRVGHQAAWSQSKLQGAETSSCSARIAPWTLLRFFATPSRPSYLGCHGPLPLHGV